MFNLTLVIDEDLLRAARVKALREGTSVSEICWQATARFAGPMTESENFSDQLCGLSNKLSRQAKLGATVGAVAVSREAMYDQVMAERAPTHWAAAGPAAAAKPRKLK